MYIICKDGSTPLDLACAEGHKEVALMLIEHGASVADKDNVSVMTVHCMSVHEYIYTDVCVDVVIEDMCNFIMTCVCMIV